MLGGASRGSLPRGSGGGEPATRLTELRVEVALGHLGHVVLVQELALVPLLAQPPQPVFAHDRLLAADVAERAHAPCRGRRVGGWVWCEEPGGP